MTPLRIAMFLGSFPEVSETFILGQLTGLLDLGHEVDIYANSKPESGAPVHAELTRYHLLERTSYIDGPTESLDWELPIWPLRQRTWPPGSATSIPNTLRLARALPKLLRCLATAPRLTWRTLDAAEYGCQAASLSCMYRLATLSASAKHYDVLHAHFGPVANSFRFARSLWRAPLVVTFHGYDFCVMPREAGPNVYHPLFQTVDAVTVNSEYTRAKIIELGCPAERIHNLHVGLNLDQFPFLDRVRQPAEPARLLTVGRLVEKKGIEYAIRAMATLQHNYPVLRYEIIGDGPLRSSLEQLTQKLGLEGKVVLHGARDSQFVQERMAAAHVFILPSVTAADGDQEGTPVSLMEAQASGLPVLATRHSGIPEVVLDGVSGFLLPERDVEGLAQKLVYLLENPEVCRALGARGRQHVENQFDLRKLNQDLAVIYRQTMARFDAREESPRASLK